MKKLQHLKHLAYKSYMKMKNKTLLLEKEISFKTLEPRGMFSFLHLHPQGNIITF